MTMRLHRNCTGPPSTPQSFAGFDFDEMKNLMVDIRAKIDKLTDASNKNERHMATLGAKVYFLLGSVKSGSLTSNISHNEYQFSPIDNADQLIDLDQKLLNAEFKKNLVSVHFHYFYDNFILTFSHSFTDAVPGFADHREKNVDSRMSCALDLILSNMCQAQCTWTGQSHICEKLLLLSPVTKIGSTLQINQKDWANTASARSTSLRGRLDRKNKT